MSDIKKYHFSEEYEFDNENRPGSQKGKEKSNPKRRNQEKKSQAITISIVAVLVVAALSLFIAFTQTGLTSAYEENLVVTDEMLPEETGFAKITLMATGDNLLHTKLYTEASNRADGNGYDFTYLYENVASLTKDSDICFINQETPLATALYEPSSYPLFNTPSECVTALHDIGFNVFNIVSNHSLDKGASGLKATIDVMESIDDSLYIGSYYTEEDMEKLHYMEIDGVKIAFLGFTEMTNGLVKTEEEPVFVYTSDEATMEALITDANKKADVVVVSVHWGEENVTTANTGQRELAQKFADWGADLVIGHHPHVLEEIEDVTASDGRIVPIIYSLGNFTSTMETQANQIGGFFKCNFIVDKATGEVIIADEEFIPTINYFTSGKNNIRVIPVSEYTEELQAANGLGITMDFINELLDSTVGRELIRE